MSICTSCPSTSLVMFGGATNYGYSKTFVLNKIKKFIDSQSLEYYWWIRVYLTNHADNGNKTDKSLKTIANQSLKYYNDNQAMINSDISLSTIYELCNDQKHWFDPGAGDPVVYDLASQFNQISESDRKLHKCYDCGTVARAIFMRLIIRHRTGEKVKNLQPDTDIRIPLSKRERNRIKRMYRLKRGKQLEEVDKCYKKLKQMKSGVQILSLGYGDFGHIWIIEKLHSVRLGSLYRIYQSSLRSYLLVDFLRYMDYANNKDKTFNIDKFFSQLSGILDEKEWTNDDENIFVNLFKFIAPVDIGEHVKPGFAYTYIEY